MIICFRSENEVKLAWCVAPSHIIRQRLMRQINNKKLYQKKINL